MGKPLAWRNSFVNITLRTKVVRSLGRLIENQGEKALSYAVLKNELLESDLVEVDFRDNDILLKKVSPSSVKFDNL